MSSSTYVKTISSWAQSKIKSPALQRCQLTLNLCFMRIYKIVRRNYEPQNDNNTSAQFKEKCRPLPRPHPVWFLYDYLSTCWLVLATAKYLLPRTSARFAVWLASFVISVDYHLPANCYLPGRLIMLEMGRSEVAASLAMFNLSLRLIPNIFNRPLTFSLLDFLYQNRADLERYYYAIGGLDENSSDKRIPEQLIGHPYNRFMCHQVWHSKADCNRRRSSYLKLRWNRTRHAHRQIIDAHSRAVLTAYGGFALIMLSSLITGTAFLVLDKGYLYSYPHCDPSLEELNTSGRLPWLQVTFSRHRVVMYVIDILDNFFIWLDSTLVLIHMYVLVYLLDFDLRLCWRHLCDCVRAHTETLTWPQATTDRTLAEDKQLNELKYQMNDFFVQLRQVDLFVSDCITICVTFWLFSISLVVNQCIRYFYDHPTFLYELGIPLKFQTFIGLSMFVGSIPLSSFSALLFRMHTQCRRAYLYLCSLTTKSHFSATARVRFSRDVFEFFVQPHRYSYRLFQAYPFTATTYLSLIPWTGSLLAILSNLVDFSHR